MRDAPVNLTGTLATVREVETLKRRIAMLLVVIAALLWVSGCETVSASHAAVDREIYEVVAPDWQRRYHADPATSPEEAARHDRTCYLWDRHTATPTAAPAAGGSSR